MGRPKPPYLDVKNADALEAPLDAWAKNDFLGLSHVAAVLLIKIQILLDLQAVQNTTMALNGTIPPEIIQLIRGQFVGGIVESRPFQSDQKTTRPSDVTL